MEYPSPCNLVLFLKIIFIIIMRETQILPNETVEYLWVFNMSDSRSQGT